MATINNRFENLTLERLQEIYDIITASPTTVVWGSITGTLSSQLDLQAALNAKFNSPTGTISQYIRGDGSLATFPTIPGGTVTAVTATSPMASTGGTTPNLSMSSANGTTDGYLLSSDWLIFNSKFNTPTGTTLQYVRGDGSLATFPAIPAQYNPTAGTGISITGVYPNQTITNTAPDQTVVLNSGTGISTSGTYPSFTITNAAPDQTVALTAGTGIGITGSYPNFTITNSSPSSGGTVTSVTGTAPIASSGGNTPTISISQATTSTNGYLSSTDWNTFNNKQNALTLTTTGTSGAATLVGATLNIPQYAGGSSYTYLIFVEVLADLPAPVGGVITLVDNTAYYFTTTVDLVGNRLVCGINTTILGSSSENCRIKSTGLVGTALITSNYSLPMRGITIEADVALNLDGDAVTTAIDWFGVNFTDCNTVGLIKDYSNVIMSDSAFLNSGNLTFDGTIGTVGLSQCLFNCNAAGTVFILPSTLTISRRFRVIYSSFLVLAGETGINLNASASVPNDGYILTYCNFSGGGTYLTGVDQTSNKALFINNIGITNTSNVGHYYMQNNGTATTIGTGNQNVWIKAAGTTVVGIGNSPKWTTAVTNRLTYAGSVTTDFVITVVGSISSVTQNITLGVGIAENGTIQNEAAVSVRCPTAAVPFAFSVQDVIQVATGDYFEVFVRNESGTNNCTLSDVNVIIQKVTG